jgi:hypothetical protein
MFELFLIASFTAFFLAILDPLIDFLSIMVSSIALNATFSLGLSWVANYLVGTKTIKDIILKAVAGAFFGRVLLKATERLTTYRSATVNQAR